MINATTITKLTLAASLIFAQGCTIAIYPRGASPERSAADQPRPIVIGLGAEALEKETATEPSPLPGPKTQAGPVAAGGEEAFTGRRRGALAEKRDEAPEDEPALQLNFAAAPVADASRAIVNQALGLPLAVADGVKGAVTLSSPEPVPASVALRALEDVLAESGLALIETETGFLLTTLEAASDRAQPIIDSAAGLGYGVTIKSIGNTAPSEVARLIEPFVSSRLTVTPDDQNGVLFLRGPQSDVQTAIDAIALFDAPWLSDQVFGLFQLRYAEADPLKAEMEALYGSGGAVRQGVELIALPRLNALFITARNQERYNEAQSWIRRLDRPAGGPKRRLYFYAAKNVDAETLAASLTSVVNSGRDGATPGALTGQDQPIIVANEASNALIIRATVEQYEEILDIVERMDALPAQVLIEASIVEVILTDDLSYGVQWFLAEGRSSVGFPDATGGVAATVPSAAYTYISTDVRVAINALNSITDVTVLSTPSVMAQNNQTATLQVGDEVPIITQTLESVNDSNAPIRSTVQLRDTGVILEVKPRVNAGDTVVLEVSQEVSNAIDTESEGIETPTIQQRKFATTVAVEDGKTIALGGLIRDSQTETESRVPVLGRAPLLGNLFRSKSFNNRRTELIVFLTPRIIRNTEDAEDVLQELRDKMQGLQQRMSAGE
ncbi:MAG: type II secretion system secretin GspD [Pseudomonadota bacterium]